MPKEILFVTACDMPYITCKVIRFLHACAKDYDAAVPTWEDGKFEPLCAVYRRAAILSYFETSEEKNSHD